VMHGGRLLHLLMATSEVIAPKVADEKRSHSARAGR
jgi:hypothetical protein